MGKDQRTEDTTVVGRLNSARTLTTPRCTMVVLHSTGQRMSGMRERFANLRGHVLDLPHGPRSRKRMDGLVERKVAIRR